MQGYEARERVRGFGIPQDCVHHRHVAGSAAAPRRHAVHLLDNLGVSFSMVPESLWLLSKCTPLPIHDRVWQSRVCMSWHACITENVSKIGGIEMVK
jgi:hypothetical protein